MPNYDHRVIVEIKKKYGDEAMEDFLRARLDQMDAAPSASYTVKIVWNRRLERKATLAEVIHFAKACGDVLIKQRNEAPLQTETKHKRPRRNMPRL